MGQKLSLAVSRILVHQNLHMDTHLSDECLAMPAIPGVTSVASQGIRFWWVWAERSTSFPTAGDQSKDFIYSLT